MIISVLLLFLLGGATGVVGGYLGIGGGVVLVPILTEMFISQDMGLDRAMTAAFATSLLTAIFTTGSSAWTQFRQKNIIPAAVPWTAAGAIFGGQIGAWLGSNLKGSLLHTFFAVFLLLCAVYLVSDFRKSADTQDPEIKPPALIILGFITGILAALFGVGGGILMVPAFIFIFKFPPSRCAGTSSSIAFPIAISGVIGYLMYGAERAGIDAGFWGVIDMQIAIPVAAGTVISARWGAKLNKKFGGTVYKKVFAIFLAIVALRMLILH